MATNLTPSSFQNTLTAENVAQQLDPQSSLSGEPQLTGIIIRAMGANTGIIYIGGSAAEATAAEGFELKAGDAVSMNIEGTGKIWFNGTKTGDKVCVLGVGP